MLKDNKKRFLDDGYKSYGEKMTLITENYEDSIRGVLDWKILVYFNSRRFSVTNMLLLIIDVIAPVNYIIIKNKSRDT